MPDESFSLMDEQPPKAKPASIKARIAAIWWTRTGIGRTLKPFAFKKDGFRAARPGAMSLGPPDFRASGSMDHQGRPASLLTRPFSLYIRTNEIDDAQ